ncbi:MAG TPA: hypothetical protein EYO78_04440 [Gammaproteobacteria bacterium]|nr:hypothetical protein [Gammaproteobacteria bacterium]
MAERFLDVVEGRHEFRKNRQDVITYRKAVLHNRCQIGYPIQQDNIKQDDIEQGEPSFDQPVIPPSLVWRFVGWFGGLSLMLDKAREMILKKNPNSLCHRVTGCVDPDKARSPERLCILETAQQLLLVLPEWEELHGCKFFPRFATGSGFG